MKSLIEQIREPESRVLTVVFFTLLMLQSLIGPMDLNVYPNRVQVGYDWLVFMKLGLTAVVSLAAAWALIFVPSVRMALCTLPALAITGILCFTVLGATSGINGGAMPASVINFFNLVFVIAALEILGIRNACTAILAAITITGILGLFLFYVFPTYGVFGEPVDNGEFVDRLGGLAHPNSVARTVLIGLILTTYLYRVAELEIVAMCVLWAIFGWSVVLAKSRTAMLGGMIGLLVLCQDRFRTRVGAYAILLAGAMGLAGLFLLFSTGNEDKVVNKLVGMVSKTGKMEELTSATGRTDIWAEAARLISLRPLVGYGLNSGPFLLQDHSSATHNTIMHASLSGGVFAGALMLALHFWMAWQVVFHPNRAVAALTACIFVFGLAEDAVLETFPGPCTLLWYACCIYPLMQTTTVFQRVPLSPSPSNATNQLVTSS